MKKNYIVGLLMIIIALSSGFLAADMPRGQAASTPTISAYEYVASGTPSVSSWSISNPTLGTTSVEVEIWISGVAPLTVWGWAISGVTWNPAVLELTKVKEGSYLTDSGDTTLFIGSNSAAFDNTAGELLGGVADADASTGSPATTDTAASLAYLFFTVIGYGVSPVDLSGGNLRADSADTTGTDVPTYNATITVINPNPSATPSPTPSPTPLPGSSISLTVSSDYGSPSPGVGNTNYNSGQSVTCSVPTTLANVNGVEYNVISQDGVTYACTGWTGTGSVPASGYTTSVTFTITTDSKITWNWIMTPPSLDIWTNRGGRGWNSSSAAFGPQEQVTLTANLTSAGGAPVAQETIPFIIADNGAQIASRTAVTNTAGIASVTYTLPWPSPNPTSAFGIMDITSTVDLAGTILNDSCAFMYNYLLKTTSVIITNGNDPSSPDGPSFSRYTGPTLSATVTVKTINWSTTSFYLTATIYDNNSVPVSYVSLPETINPAQSGNPDSTKSQTYTINLSIPSYAFVGSAYIYVNIYTTNPANLGVPFCPETSAPLVIDSAQ